MEDILIQKASETKDAVIKEVEQIEKRKNKGEMSFSFCCPLCGKSYITFSENLGKYAKCRTCEYLFEVKEKTNITALFKTTFIDRILVHGSDVLFNELDKLIVKISIKRKKENSEQEGLVNYDSSELLFFTDYIVCELLKLERLSKKTYREMVYNFLKIHEREFNANRQEKYGRTFFFSEDETNEINKQRTRIGEYLRYLSNIAASWEAVIQYDKDNSLIFQAVEKVIERLSHYLFKGKIIPDFVEEAVEIVQLFFGSQVGRQRKYQNLIMEEVIKVKKI